jgi:hypothetical protein
VIVEALLLTAAAPSAVDAERAFADRAQTDGLWTAFRATAASSAAMFVPHHVDAQTWLKDRKDPLLGYMWWPAQAYVSCDGTVAATTGPSVHGATRGYFTTVWARQSDGSWKWLLDHGDRLASPRPAGEKPMVRRAACPRGGGPGQWVVTTAANGRSAGIGGGGVRTEGLSGDGSLKWSSQTQDDGSRRIEVLLWEGRRHVPVIVDEVAAARP